MPFNEFVHKEDTEDIKQAVHHKEYKPYDLEYTYKAIKDFYGEENFEKVKRGIMACNGSPVYLDLRCGEDIETGKVTKVIFDDDSSTLRIVVGLKNTVSPGNHSVALRQTDKDQFKMKIVMID